MTRMTLKKRDIFHALTAQPKIRIVLYLVLISSTLIARAQSIEGLWDATITSNGISIPFQMEVSGRDNNVRSYFFNGNDNVNPSSSGSF